MDKNDLKKVTLSLKKIKDLIGKSEEKKTIKVEFLSRKNARRSIYANTDIYKGAKIKRSDLICKRPGTGVTPLKFDKIVGKVAKKNIKKDDLIKLNSIKV